MTHRNLKVWDKSINLVADIYELTNTFPQDEKYGMVSQMRRSAISIPSNIAEGAARKSTKEYIQFLFISLGSLSELETQLIISDRIGYCTSENPSANALNEIRKMLTSLINSLESKT